MAGKLPPFAYSPLALCFYHLPHCIYGPCHRTRLELLSSQEFSAICSLPICLPLPSTKKVDSALAGILNSLTPLLVIAIGALFFKAHVHLKKIIGVLIGFLGLVILSVSKGGITVANFWFAFFILFATLCYGINVNLVSFYLKDVDPIKMATISLAFICIPAGIIMWQQNIPTLVFNDKSYHLPVLAALVLGVIGSAAATALFYVLIRRSGGLFASLVTYGIPIVAILWGIWYKENVTAIQLGCLGLILSGVYLANRP